MRQFCEQVAVAFIEAVRVEAGTSRGDAEDGETALPCPGFDVLAEAQTDLTIAMTVFHDESADEGMRCRLKMMLDRYFDPADHFVPDACNERGLILSAGW